MAKGEGTKVKLLFKILIVLVILISQVVIAYILITKFINPKLPESQAAEVAEAEADADSTEEEEDDGEIGEIFVIDDLVVNPAGTNGRRFVALSLGLELYEDVNIDDIKKRKPLINDTVLRILIKKHFNEFINIEHREKIREEMFQAIVETLPEKTVRQLYIMRFIIQ